MITFYVVQSSFVSSQFRPTCRSALSHSQGSNKRFAQIVNFLATKKFSSPMISEYVESSITTFLALDCEFK